MLNSLRSGRPLHPQSLTSFSLSTPRTPSSVIRFVRAASDGPNEMDSKKQSKPESESESKTTDPMSSFGEGYATRSDEEGFGGIYRGNQYVSKDDEEKEFDHEQGSEVKEKEKARNQHKVGSQRVEEE